METKDKQAGIAQEDNHIKFDYTLETPEERSAHVQKIIDNTPPEKLTKYYLEKMFRKDHVHR